MLAAWLVSLALVAHASAERYTLHHRFLPSGTFVPRGTVDVVDGAATFTPSDGALAPGQGWYQVGLESVGGDMITTSTQACFAGEDARLVIHVAQNGRPTSIAYTPTGVPNDGSCTLSPSAVAAGLQVALAAPQKVYSPGLAAPPEVDEGGKVKEPEPEKTFLQKYGLMIGGFIFVLLMNAAGPDPPKEGGGGGGAGGGAGGAAAQ